MNLEKLFVRNGKSVFGELQDKKEKGPEASPEEIMNRFPEVLRAAFPNSQEEARKGKTRSVYVLTFNGELLLDGREIAEFLQQKKLPADKFANTIKFYQELSKTGGVPSRIKVPVNHSDDASKWIESYLYTSRLKTWMPRSSYSDYDEEKRKYVYTVITPANAEGREEAVD